MSSGFISEVEIAAAKQKRQAEWEKVRQPDEPLGSFFFWFYVTIIYLKLFLILFIALYRNNRGTVRFTITLRTTEGTKRQKRLRVR